MEVQEGVGVGLLGAVATKAIEAFARAFGTRKERAEAEAIEATPSERAADLALRIAEQAKGERDDCHARLDVITGELDAIRVELRECDVRAAKQQSEIAWMARAIKAIQKTHSEPPPPES